MERCGSCGQVRPNAESFEAFIVGVEEHMGVIEGRRVSKKGLKETADRFLSLNFNVGDLGVSVREDLPGEGAIECAALAAHAYGMYKAFLRNQKEE